MDPSGVEKVPVVFYLWPAKVGPVRASLSPFTSSRKSPGHIPGIVPTSKGAVKSILLVYRPGSIPTPCFHRRLNLDSNQPTASTTRRFIKRLLTTRPANHNRKQPILRTPPHTAHSLLHCKHLFRPRCLLIPSSRSSPFAACSIRRPPPPPPPSPLRLFRPPTLPAPTLVLRTLGRFCDDTD